LVTFRYRLDLVVCRVAVTGSFCVTFTVTALPFRLRLICVVRVVVQFPAAGYLDCLPVTFITFVSFGRFVTVLGTLLFTVRLRCTYTRTAAAVWFFRSVTFRLPLRDLRSFRLLPAPNSVGFTVPVWFVSWLRFFWLVVHVGSFCFHRFAGYRAFGSALWFRVGLPLFVTRFVGSAPPACRYRFRCTFTVVWLRLVPMHQHWLVLRCGFLRSLVVSVLRSFVPLLRFWDTRTIRLPRLLPARLFPRSPPFAVAGWVGFGSAAFWTTLPVRCRFWFGVLPLRSSLFNVPV